MIKSFDTQHLIPRTMEPAKKSGSFDLLLIDSSSLIVAQSTTKTRENHLISSHKNTHSQSGQAIVEYVLLMVAVVGIAFLFFTAFAKPFSNFMRAYVGDYTSCLLETGELPTLGANPDLICANEFQAFSIFKGRPANINSNNSSSSTSGSSASSSSKSSSKSKSNKENANENDSDTSSSTSTSSSSRSNARAFRLGQKAGPINADGDQKTANELVINEGSSKANSRMGSNNQYVNIPGRDKNFQIRQDEGSSIGQALQRQRAREQGKSKIISNQIENTGKKNRKFAIKDPSENRQIAMLDSEQDLGLGDWIRYFIIGAIILAIILAVGFAAQEISSSMKRSK